MLTDNGAIVITANRMIKCIRVFLGILARLGKR